MGNNRQNDKRASKIPKTDLVYFIRSLFMALDNGLMCWPKHLYHFETAIRHAFNGDLGPLEHAVKLVEKRSKYVVDNDDDDISLIRWKGGMAGFYLAQHVSLTELLSLFTKYHRDLSNATDKLPARAFGNESIQSNKQRCIQLEEDTRNCGRSQRREL